MINRIYTKYELILPRASNTCNIHNLSAQESQLLAPISCVENILTVQECKSLLGSVTYLLSRVSLSKVKERDIALT
jgi:hypothetical protein